MKIFKPEFQTSLRLEGMSEIQARESLSEAGEVVLLLILAQNKGS